MDRPLSLGKPGPHHGDQKTNRHSDDELVPAFSAPPQITGAQILKPIPGSDVPGLGKEEHLVETARCQITPNYGPTPFLDRPLSLAIRKSPYSCWPVPKSIYSASQEKLQNLLKSTRESEGFTQAALAAKLKRPQSFVSKYESGERRLDLVELREICEALKISLVDFVKRFDRS